MDARRIEETAMENWAAMKENGSPTFAMEMTRDRREDPELTFSMEAIDGLMGATGAWVLTRLQRHFEETGRGVKRMRFIVTTVLETEDERSALNAEPFTIDLDYRRDAEQG